MVIYVSMLNFIANFCDMFVQALVNTVEWLCFDIKARNYLSSTAVTRFSKAPGGVRP